MLEYCLADTLSIVRLFLTLFYLPCLFQKTILMHDLDNDYNGESDSGHRRGGSGLDSGKECDGVFVDVVRKQFEEGMVLVPRLRLCLSTSLGTW